VTLSEDRLVRLQPGARRRRPGRRRLWLVGLVIVAAIAFLVAKGLTSSIVYFKTANQAVADRAQLGGQSFRIEGLVVPGTVRSRGDLVSFVIESNRVRVPVVNRGSPPQLFQAGIPVVLQGHFQGRGDRFLSDQILVKHTATYIAAHPRRVTAPNGTRR
jgi:cytochrome c-type biogenesis protein CcmE